MNVKDVGTLIVSIVLGIIVVSTILVPIIESSEKIIVHRENNPDALYTMVNSSDSNEYVIEFSNSNLTINGVVVADESRDGYVVSDSFVFRTNVNEGYGMDCLNEVRVQTDNFILTINGNEYSYTFNGTDYTGTYSFLLIPDLNGNLGYYTTDVYVNKGESVYYAYTGGYTPDPVGDFPNFFIECVDGVQTRSLQQSYFSGFGGDRWEIREYEPSIELTDISDNGLDSTNLLYNWDASYTLDLDGTSMSRKTFSIIAPVEYDYISTDDGVLRTLLEMIPIFATLGLIVGGFAWFRFRT